VFFSRKVGGKCVAGQNYISQKTINLKIKIENFFWHELQSGMLGVVVLAGKAAA